MIKNYPKIKFSKRFRETNNILLSLSFKKKKSSHNKRLHFISSSIASLFHFQRVLFFFFSSWSQTVPADTEKKEKKNEKKGK